MIHALHFAQMMWREQKRHLLVGAIASFLTLFSAVALLGLSGWFITAAGLAGLAGTGLAFDFFRPSAGIRFLAFFRTAARYGERLLTHDATLRFFASLRANLFRSIAFSRDLDRRFRSSELLQRLTGDLEAIDSLYLRVLLPALVATAVFVLACMALFTISPALMIAAGLVFAVAAAALLFGAYFARKPARRIALGTESLRIRSIDLSHAQTDMFFSGSLTVQIAKIGKAASYLANAGKHLARIEIGTSAAIALAGAALTLAFLVLGGAAIAEGTISGPVAAMVVIGGLATLEVLAPLRRGAVELGRIAFSGRRLHALEASSSTSDERIPISKELAVAMAGVTYRRGNRAKPILENFNIAVRPGERVAVTGRSGCGKSTLLSLAAGLLKPESGQIFIRNTNDGRPSIGYLTQETELFHGTIAENLRIAAPAATDRELWHALEVAELRKKVEALKEGIDWQLGEMGNGFSGGERRRLALARLVLRRSSIWLLDEPTAGMDEALANRVLANLLNETKGSTWIVAAHHVREIAPADRVIKLLT